MFERYSERYLNEDKMPDKYEGNDEIIFLKTKETSKGAHYNLYYNGHDIDVGGRMFKNRTELDQFAAEYILSNQLYNKLKYEKPKPLPESVDEANNTVYKKGDKVLIRLVHKGGVGKYADAMSTSDNTEESRIKKRIKNKITGGYKYELFNGIEVYPSEIVGLAESVNEAKSVNKDAISNMNKGDFPQELKDIIPLVSTKDMEAFLKRTKIGFWEISNGRFRFPVKDKKQWHILKMMSHKFADKQYFQLTESVNEANDKVDVASLSIGNTYKDNKGYPVKVIDIKGTGSRWKITYQYEDGKKKTVSTSLDKGINLYESIVNEGKDEDYLKTLANSDYFAKGYETLWGLQSSIKRILGNREISPDESDVLDAINWLKDGLGNGDPRKTSLGKKLLKMKWVTESIDETLVLPVNEKPKSKRKPVTKQMWNKLSDDDKVDLLLTVFSDPNDAEDHMEDKWEELPPIATSNMVIYEARGRDIHKSTQFFNGVRADNGDLFYSKRHGLAIKNGDKLQGFYAWEGEPKLGKTFKTDKLHQPLGPATVDLIKQYYPNSKKHWDTDPETMVDFAGSLTESHAYAEAMKYAINENENRVYGMFTDDQGKPTKLDKELLDIALKGLPTKITKNIDAVEANGYGGESHISPPTVSNKGQSRGEIEYKMIHIGLLKPMGRNKITAITLGLRKRTSGPGTGYLYMKVAQDWRHTLGPEAQGAIEFWDDPASFLQKLYNEKFKNWF